MNTLTVLYIAFLAAALVAIICIFAMNENCKKTENILFDTLKERDQLVEDREQLIRENRQLKAALLYERTKDNANVL